MASNFVVRLMQELDDADQLARTCGPALLVVCTEQLDWLPICQLFCELFAVKRYGACPLTELAANGHVDDLRQHRLPPLFSDHARASADALITEACTLSFFNWI